MLVPKSVLQRVPAGRGRCFPEGSELATRPSNVSSLAKQTLVHVKYQLVCYLKGLMVCVWFVHLTRCSVDLFL